MKLYNDILMQINPSVSNKTLAEAVINKSNARRRATVRKLCVTSIVAILLAGMTISAGAINNWDYPGIARFFFGGSENVIEGMHDEIRYLVTPDSDRSVKKNPAGNIENSNFSIEITGLYADNETILIAFDIITDEPAFDFEQGGTLNPAMENGEEILYNNTLNMWEPVYSVSTLIKSNSGSSASAVYRINRLDNTIETGNVYTLMFHGIEMFMGIDAEDNAVFSYPIGNDATEIKFIIDTLAMDNNKTIYPDIALENGNIITEMKITPFAILLHFDGIEKTPTGDDYWFETDIIIINPDNLEIESVMFNNFITIMNHDGKTSELINVTYESIADSNTRKTWIRFDIDFTQTLNINDIAAIIYRGTKIPVG